MKTSFSIVLASAAIAIGCSGGENIGQTPPAEGGAGGSATDAPAGMDASVDASSDVSSQPDGGASDSSRVDGFIDIFDAFPIPDGPIGDCVSCIRDRCGTQVNQCVNNDACRAGLQCTFTTCAAMGTFDQACVLGCFTDPAAAFAAVGALTCIGSNCGAACMPNMEGGATDGSSQPDSTSGDATPADGAGSETGVPEASPPSDSGNPGD
jgi:hypothetical protein